MSNVPPPIDYASLGFTPQPKPKGGRHLIGWMLFIGLAIMFFLLMRQGNSSRSAQAVSFGRFRSDLLAGNVRSVFVSSDELEYTVYSGTRTSANSVTPPTFPSTNNRVQLPQDMGKDWRFIQWLSEEHSNVLTDIQFANDQNLVINLLLPLIPWLLIFGFIYFFVFRTLRNNQNQRWQKPMPVVIVNPDSLPKP